jgi:hypothetical protein
LLQPFKTPVVEKLLRTEDEQAQLEALTHGGLHFPIVYIVCRDIPFRKRRLHLLGKLEELYVFWVPS